jgi:hypothetical protein
MPSVLQVRAFKQSFKSTKLDKIKFAMYNGLLHAHSGLRWLVLLFIIIAAFKALMKWRSAAPFTEGDRKLNLYTLIATHVQLLIGLALYFISEKVRFEPEAMKDPISRFYTAEHSVMMLLAVVLVTVGYIRAKRATEDALRFRSTAIYFMLALAVLLAGIPWPFRNLGAGWF